MRRTTSCSWRPNLKEDKEAGEVLLDVTWQVLKPPGFDYNVFFQALVLNEDATQVVAQLDVQPMNGERPATTWRNGEIFNDTYRLELPDIAEVTNLERCSATLLSGAIYDWRDGARMPVDGGIDDKVIFYGE